MLGWSAASGQLQLPRLDKSGAATPPPESASRRAATGSLSNVHPSSPAQTVAELEAAEAAEAAAGGAPDAEPVNSNAANESASAAAAAAGVAATSSEPPNHRPVGRPQSKRPLPAECAGSLPPRPNKQPRAAGAVADTDTASTTRQAIKPPAARQPELLAAATDATKVSCAAQLTAAQLMIPKPI